MKSKNEFKRIDIKNHVCYYFDHTTSGTKINFINILLNKILYENISVFNIPYKTPTGSKPLCITFDEIDGFVISLGGKLNI